MPRGVFWGIRGDPELMVQEFRGGQSPLELQVISPEESPPSLQKETELINGRPSETPVIWSPVFPPPVCPVGVCLLTETLSNIISPQPHGEPRRQCPCPSP